MLEVRLTATPDAPRERVCALFADAAGDTDFIESCRYAQVIARNGDDVATELTLHLALSVDRYPVCQH